MPDACCKNGRMRIRNVSNGRAGSIMSIGSAGSILSIGSAGSILSIGSAGSILSIGSAGSILSVNSVYSFASAFSIGSFASFASILSGLSSGSVRSWRSSRRTDAAVPADPQPADGAWLRGGDLDDGGGAHAAAGAHGGHADAAAAAAQLVHQGHDHPGAGGGHRVAERAAAAVHVDLLRVEFEQLDGGHAHRRERLVDLEQVHLVGRQGGTGQRLRDRLDRGEPGPRGVDAD